MPRHMPRTAHEPRGVNKIHGLVVAVETETADSYHHFISGSRERPEIVVVGIDSISLSFCARETGQHALVAHWGEQAGRQRVWFDSRKGQIHSACEALYCSKEYAIRFCKVCVLSLIWIG